MTALLRFLVAVTLAAGSLAACKPGADGSKENPFPAVRKVVDRQLDLEITGDVALDFEGRHKMQFYSRPSNRSDLMPATVATVSTRVPLEFAPGRGIIVGISVVGNYTGDGTYTVVKRNLEPSPGETLNLSIIRTEIYDITVSPATFVERIDVDEKACKVVIRKHAQEGSLDCPEIRNDAGDKKIAVRMTWRPVR